MNRSPLFVTGTDTGVGKTTVARGLLRLARRERWPLFPVKPVETGCPRVGDGSLRPLDGAELARAAGFEHAIASVAPHRFELAAAPSIAANEAGKRIDVVELSNLIASVSNQHEVLIEGAGGLLVPLNERETLADLAFALKATLLVVSRDALGTLNHTLLTLESARARGLNVAGVVLNAASPEPCKLDNRSSLESFVGKIPIWGPVTWAAHPTDDDLADALLAVGLSRRSLELRWT